MNVAESYLHIGKGGRSYWGDRGAGILFTDGRSILLLKRAHEGAADHAGFWGIPGGKAKKGEAPIDTAVRESKEEVGTVEGSRFGQLDEIDGRHRFCVFLYRVREPFSVKLSHEHDDYAWVKLEDLRDYHLHPRFQEGLPHYLRAIQRKFNRRA